MNSQYSFVTRWQIRAPLPEVWDAIYLSLEWPQWWKGVLAVKEIAKGDEQGVGGIREYTWKSILPYRLVFKSELTELDKYCRMKGEASGELEGDGEWFFEEKNGITYVQYNWNVYTTRTWMNWCSFLLKPAFRYNHNIVMKWGALGLAKKLQAALISC